MARKVFISFLGTGNYVNCKYEFSDRDGVVSEPVRFIQEAIIKQVCVDWTKDDKIFIFCTGEAYDKNWVDEGHVDPSKPNKQLEDIEKVGLETRLKNTQYWSLVEMHKIEDGFDEKQVWSIFDEVYRHLREGDELYFDVTHAFRSIPMFSTILFNYASFMKNIEIKSIQYGAFEKLGPSFKVKEEIPLENRIAPVLNLTEMIRLQQYTDIASSFVTFGRVRKLSDTLKSENLETNSVVRDVYNALESFDNALLTNRISEIEAGKYMIAIKNSVKPIARKEDIPTPIKDILRRLHNELNRFGFLPEKSYKNIEAAISWAKHFKMLPQAYTMGQEYIITLVVSLFEEHSPFTKDKDGKKNFRMFMSSICSIGDDDVKIKNYKGMLNQYPDVADKLLKESLINELRPFYADFGEKRNAVNHGKGDVAYKTLVEEFDRLYNKCLNIIKSNLSC
jgi:CRISPR-associated Csx2 family protein